MNRISTRSALAVLLSLAFSGQVFAASSATWDINPVPLGTNIVDGFLLPFGPTGAVIGNLDGFVANDLVMNTTSDWTATLLQVNLTSGSIWQEPDDTATVTWNGATLGKPNPAFYTLATLASSEFDSYMTGGDGTGSTASIGGACADISPNPCPLQFDSSGIDITWNSLGQEAGDIGIFSIARVTLSPDAQGSWLVKFTVAGFPTAIETSGVVVNGALVPEPASLSLLSLSGLGLLRRRRDRCGDEI